MNFSSGTYLKVLFVCLQRIKNLTKLMNWHYSYEVSSINMCPYTMNDCNISQSYLKLKMTTWACILWQTPDIIVWSSFSDNWFIIVAQVFCRIWTCTIEKYEFRWAVTINSSLCFRKLITITNFSFSISYSNWLYDKYLTMKRKSVTTCEIILFFYTKSNVFLSLDLLWKIGLLQLF